MRGALTGAPKNPYKCLVSFMASIKQSYHDNLSVCNV